MVLATLTIVSRKTQRLYLARINPTQRIKAIVDNDSRHLRISEEAYLDLIVIWRTKGHAIRSADYLPRSTILLKYSSLANIYDLPEIMISKPYQNPTSPCEKRGLGIQCMASPRLGLTDNSLSSSESYQGGEFVSRILMGRGYWGSGGQFS
jgi:hypothetical protein